MSDIAESKRLVQLSGPSQATTLLADAFIQGAGYSFPDWRTLNLSSACARVQEFFNPECHHDGRLRSVLHRCFGLSFRVCERSESAEAISSLEATSATYAKENFATMAIDLFAAMPGRYDVVVSFRPPWLTFPLDRPWYPKMYRTFLASSTSDERRWPAASGHALRALKHHLARTHPPERTSESVQGCVAHYVHFFFLVTRAWALDKPVIRIDRLLTLPTVADLEAHLRAHMPHLLLDGDLAPATVHSQRRSAHALAVAIDQLRKVPTHMHSPLAGFRATEFVHGRRRGMVNASDLIHQSHANRWQQTGCAEPLAALARWCEERVGSLCARFNHEYGMGEMTVEPASLAPAASPTPTSIQLAPVLPRSAASEAETASITTDPVSAIGLRACASLNTVVGVVASARYGPALIGLSRSAAAAGFGCVAAQAVGPHWFAELGHPLVRALPSPSTADGPPLLPHAPWCNRTQMAFAYTKRLTQLYKAFMWRAVLRMGFHLLAVDCDWRFLATGTLAPSAQPGPPMVLNPAAHALALEPRMDVVALHDGYGFKQLNIGLMWMRRTPLTLALAERVLNRTRGAWDQLVLNEELSFGVAFRNISCCHTDQLLCLLNHSSSAASPAQVRELPARRCWAANEPAIPTAAAPPNGTRHRWTSPWEAQRFNTLHISMRRAGRCTLPTAKCGGWGGPRGIVRVVRPNVPAAIGLRCELVHASEPP